MGLFGFIDLFVILLWVLVGSLLWFWDIVLVVWLADCWFGAGCLWVCGCFGLDL